MNMQKPVVEKESLIVGLHDIGAVKFGEFVLKSGQKSPVYLDLRLLVSRPGMLRRVARTMQAVITDLHFDRIAAIPLAGLPIGVALSLTTDIPLLYPRLSTKSYGTGRYLEGVYKPGETVLVVDDVISQGESKLEALELLTTVGLRVNDIVVVVDRQMQGKKVLEEKGYHLHSVMTLREILDTLLLLKRISQPDHDRVMRWLDQQETT